MNTTMNTAVDNGSSLRRTAVGAALVALALMAVGGYVDTPFRAQSDGGWGLSGGRGVPGLLFAIAFAAAGAAVVFGVVTRRALRKPPARTAVTALVVALVALPASLVFWTGLPVLLAFAAATLALDARRRSGSMPVCAVAALALAALAMASAVWLAFSG
ncbi:hypothetical protein [Streptomyces sp. NPDC102360]|uniref:hypothetical protein n=1 Tax=Streptomyces sp. NPDC102360 TaxID=3366160 RepID=UPI003821A988